MKSTTMLVLLLLLTLSSQPLLGSAKPSLEQVLDISGKKLRLDADYYIIPANGGYIDVVNTDETCPFHVVIVKHSQGLPLRIAPVKGVIRVSTDLNIMLANGDNRCPNCSVVWKIDPFSKEETFLTTGGILGHPGSNSIHSWFKIEKYDDAYKLVYCPNVCPSCKHVCKDVGYYRYKNMEMRLALTNVPFKVKFQEA
ncbi:miraculin-like [Trifolium pratense]|uniref:miraculin-like n=1 Tax=Trifolium pratense TaxID=57577 RepID=UPI001E6937E2|nr:miraculin-like [Trifolium pratense]